MSKLDLNNFKLELSKISLDKTICHAMCQSDYKAFNFDAIVKKYCSKLGKPKLCSNDALMKQKDCKWLFVEFKNGTFESEDIRNKINESLLVFNDVVEAYTLEEDRENLNFILVYNNVVYPEPEDVRKSESLLEIQKRISRKSGSQFIEFGIERFKGLYFKNVYSMTEEEFIDYLNLNVV